MRCDINSRLRDNAAKAASHGIIFRCKWVLALSLAMSLIACGGEDEVTVDPGEYAAGQAQFDALCVDCHQATDAKLVQNRNLSDLETFIGSAMPLNEPTACIGQCAQQIAAYLANINPAFDPNASGTSTSSSSSTGGFGDIRVPMGGVSAPPVAIRRLNRAEYNNTVQSLLHTSQTPADNFPEDDFGYGFNNIAKVLSVSLAHLEQYKRSAESLAVEAISRSASATSLTVEAETLDGTFVTPLDDVLSLGRTGSTVSILLPIEYRGAYKISVKAAQEAGGPSNANMAVSLNGNLVKNIEVAAPQTAYETYEFFVDMDIGNNDLAFEFTNDYWVADLADRNLLIDQIVVDGPQPVPVAKVIPCDMNAGESCAQTFIQTFVPRAWRRPITAAEQASLLTLYRQAYGFANKTSDGFSALIQSVLMSPNFMFRSEIDADLGARTPYPLTAYELASRLSYFIWSDMPDDDLFQAAADGSLLDDAVLRVQVRRMLNHAKSKALVDQFAVQWLKFDEVADAHPDSTLFAGFDDALVESMRTETKLFVTDWLQNNGRVSDLVTANHTFIDGRLAQHYGVGTIQGDGFVKHTWQDGQRPGLLGHASLLTATSHPQATSPVRRGKWVLDNLTCLTPPPPPPGVENIDESNTSGALTTRQLFEKHRDKSTVCYSCHVLMDPIGFGLENFDAIGRWRDKEGAHGIDASGSLPGGFDFDGAGELAGILGNSAEMPLCVTKQLLTYALGRGIDALNTYAPEEGQDDPLVYQIYLNTMANQHRIHDLIEEIVLSPAFRSRFGAEAKGEISL